MDEQAQTFCESLYYAGAVCAFDSKKTVQELIKGMFGTICPGALPGPLVNYNFLRSVPADNTCLFGVQDDCFAIDLTGPEDPRLEIFRQFRDEVLNKIDAGPIIARQSAILIKPDLINAGPHPVTTPPECWREQIRWKQTARPPSCRGGTGGILRICGIPNSIKEEHPTSNTERPTSNYFFGIN